MKDQWYTGIRKVEEPEIRNVPEDQKVWTFDHFFLERPVMCGTVEYKVIDRVDVAVFTPLVNDAYGVYNTLAQWIFKTEEEAMDGKIEYLREQRNYHQNRARAIQKIREELVRLKDNRD